MSYISNLLFLLQLAFLFVRSMSVLIALIVASGAACADSAQIVIPTFSGQDNQQIPTKWQTYGFDDIARTDYTLVVDDGVTVLQAKSEDSASGLIHHIRFNPHDYPYISWRWKMLKAPAKSDARAKSTDDYALRLYINFDFDLHKLPFDEQFSARLYRKLRGDNAPLASLNYIWENQLSKETLIASPYTERVQMLVLQNRQSKEGVWNIEQRNIVEDYTHAFGEPPSDVISIAVMSDSDNTQGASLAYYGDIVLSKTPQK